MAPTSPGYGVLVGEDADDLGTALDLAVEAFERIGAVNFGPMIFGEGHIRQHVRLGLVQEGGEPAVRWTELVGDLAPLGLGGVGIVLGEGGGNESGDDAPAVLAGVG